MAANVLRFREWEPTRVPGNVAFVYAEAIHIVARFKLIVKFH